MDWIRLIHSLVDNILFEIYFPFIFNNGHHYFRTAMKCAFFVNVLLEGADQRTKSVLA